MKYITLDRLSGLVFILICGSYGYFAQQIPLDFFSETEVFNARSLPTMIAIFGIIVGIVQLVHPAATSETSPTRQSFGTFHVIRPTMLIGLIFGYAWFVPVTGFLITTCIFLWLSFFAMGERRWILMSGVAVILPLTFQWLMSALGIYLDPGGLWLEILGD